MKVIALVGKSGTGKSYKALSLAHEKDIEYIIDDGLLIRENKIIAGKSAKRELTKISAVKRALFLNEEHRKSVIDAIEREKPKSILILGTSEKMVRNISENLGINYIDEIVYIHDISTEEEIKLAQISRNKEGKHVIPVPTFELKKHFSGYFLNPLRIFRRKKDNTLQVSEKSVVRPTYSYRGKYVISDKAIIQIIKFVGQNTEGFYKFTKIYIKNYPHGIVVDIDVILSYGNVVTTVIRNLQKHIKREIENMTSINVLAINVCVRSLEI
ncbi:Asp23/Gls24 family envelope stress response protein [Caminicella sporogenes]|uniref:Asp23/Gls24 family envelope stress response protein n=1 Tax=Caminicella sporogenes TaxID=166485 RepID=UPI00253FBAA0|nr:Asp23/Gls24 family envelope stress response protein [Caminicella sporogenes]WIF96169.1 Asp23/Gls24 family envelope stress response protein [Caminicella sporogenes]